MYSMVMHHTKAKFLPVHAVPLVAFENGETTPYGFELCSRSGGYNCSLSPNQDVYAGMLLVKTLVNLIWMLTHVRKTSVTNIAFLAPLMKQFA